MTSKYTADDKDMFIQILGKYPIIEDKKTDAYNIHKKKVAWETVDSDGIQLHKPSTGKSVEQETPGPSSAPDVILLSEKTVPEVIPGPSVAPDVNPLPETSRKRKKGEKTPQIIYLAGLSQARLNLIKKEEEQMKELHKVSMEEAKFKRQAARLIMLQEEEKLKKY